MPAARPTLPPTRRTFMPSGGPVELRYAPEWRPFPSEAAEPRPRSFGLSWQIAAIGAGVLVVLIGLLLYLGSLRPGPESSARPTTQTPVTSGTPPPVTAGPSNGSLPAPVSGSIGRQMRLGDLRVTVLSSSTSTANVHPSPTPPAGDLLYVVNVLYENSSRSQAVAVSPYDWAVTDKAGLVYGPVPTGLPDDLTERQVPPGGEARGVVGFVIPASATGLAVHFGTEVGDEGAVVPITQ